ncbi:uncharacterized protein [Littorina saxatilis]|uniref:7-dehydrocholesterol reductase n=1 Tax=Littorina saxatilis TaxID=31220 RepID=A0AAN9GA76_9CAEN
MGKINAATTHNRDATNGRKEHPPPVETNGMGSETKGNGVSNGKTRDATMAVRPDSALKRLWEKTVMPILLMAATPSAVFILWFCAAHCGGSYACIGNIFHDKGLLGGTAFIWSHVHSPSPAIVAILVSYSAFALCLMRLVPGNTVYGPLTPKGNRPQYTDNGFSCFLITIAAFLVVTVVCKTYFSVSPTIVYDRFDEVLLVLNIFSMLFCLLLYVKGLLAPSTSDSGSSGNVIFDYYWGTELYPRLLGFDVKVFTNCRFGMTVWPLLVCVFALKSYELHGPVDSMLVSALLQMIYFAKFFWWEAGYMCTIDIMVDRAGYYICWGCLVFVPGFYASVSLYLVNRPVVLGLPLSLLIFTLGALSVYVNYDADRQKLYVRNAQGECLVWGRKPVILRARYLLDSGETRESILLASGWWGLARHFHYVPEILLAFCWSVPALFDNVMPYTYVIFLTCLLVHRCFRDDTKCSLKYGRYWDLYREKVPHQMVPYVF